MALHLSSINLTMKRNHRKLRPCWLDIQTHLFKPWHWILPICKTKGHTRQYSWGFEPQSIINQLVNFFLCCHVIAIVLKELRSEPEPIYRWQARLSHLPYGSIKWRVIVKSWEKRFIQCPQWEEWQVKWFSGAPSPSSWGLHIRFEFR